MKLREIADVLRAELGAQAHKVTTRNMPDFRQRNWVLAQCWL
jgi:flavodoxin